MDKITLKKLIRQVILESVDIEEPEAGINPDLPNLSSVNRKKGETSITLQLKGLKPGKRYKDFIAKISHEAKMADLDLIHAELESHGKKSGNWDSGELNHMADEFDTSATRSIFSKTAKGKPPVPGSREEWEKMVNVDNEKRLKKQANKKSGVVNPDDETEDWSDKQWKQWWKEEDLKRIAAKQSAIEAGTYNPRDRKYWTSQDFEKFDKNRVKEPKPTEPEVVSEPDESEA